ncbi:shwachman-Bodian-Diamond syndrome (SBDS) protein [Ditylenchus destructor]|uniref:Shwachman-Bodian-Diamond syndrome (SBDS) protein domain-containing protein n=1 Tax=Ditylenchus destructor TaxID=166010 RepID=A0AAD4NLV5_9BILA|nr:shwachman-Bodian-Diamond syndrome (SBDS) protein [Ditylenchus destructor]KAI1729235.1 shwachman-Bodian-Diamond syndrome (SBDS) protein domain-containing protein [Ditylenchus destructor]
MPGQIKTPTNQKLLTNVAVVRMKKNGKRFEIACYKNKVVNWRNKTEKDINEVLQTATVFVNVSKGQLAKREDLVAAFEMDDQMEICKMILEKGDLQVSDKERAATTETSIKEIANLIANMCVNSETKRPYSSTVIEKALRDAHFNYKSNRNAKQQALEAIPKLRESMNIERAKMRIRVSIGAKDAKNCHDRMKALFETVEVENWEKGALDMVGLVDPGHYRDISEIVQGDKKSKGELELLSLKVVSENEVEIS